ncbi:glycerophosphodiester phosphodiesterase [Litoribrevibacter albus]|uniref:Glycerophosphoryl diester phosphodiesterase n=1 Tax=Litoribrevibacter albus TaxID=1473156 RepID=A0AA37S9R4_9GAMM|nr:glycerophosphodiester phosphodiesterase family protein [Litoribrevibacter albus]GLQ31043.1 glycerophosphoryl diester phosphodiesterase [Litoribrevibacter albus]
MDVNEIDYPFLIGHRGVAGYAPENTLASLALAYKLGVRFIEVDVMLTADNHAIIFHDHTLDRTTSFKGKVSQHKWQQLQTLDSGSWFHPDFSDQGILHLKDLIEFANQHPDLKLNIELKPKFSNAIRTTRLVIQQLKREFKNPERLILSSFDPLALKTAQFLWPTCYRALNIENRYMGWPLVAINLKCKAIHIDHQEVTSGFINKCHQMNMAVRCFTVNDPYRARQLKAMLVDGIFTDRPADLFSHMF